jgi:GNAT superfamily N-acetyltransferase
MMEVTPARPGDVPALAELLAEMGRFYGEAAARPLAERVRQIGDALFTSPPAAHALLAWDGTELAGMAAYSFLWPAAGLTRSLYLKELYVGERYRRRSAGKLLMQALFEMARQCGSSRGRMDDRQRQRRRAGFLRDAWAVPAPVQGFLPGRGPWPVTGGPERGRPESRRPPRARWRTIYTSRNRMISAA